VTENGYEKMQYPGTKTLFFFGRASFNVYIRAGLDYVAAGSAVGACGHGLPGERAGRNFARASYADFSR
jgi:hypothetical protein